MSDTVTYGNVLLNAMNQSIGVSDAGLDAARRGLVFCSKVNAKTGIDSVTVLTDAGFLQTIPAGKQIVIYCFYAYLNTASDWLDFEFIATANADGSGDVLALTPKFRIETGTAASADAPTIVSLAVPLLIKHAATAKALTMRVQGNDSSASATLGFIGWHEDLT